VIKPNGNIQPTCDVGRKANLSSVKGLEERKESTGSDQNLNTITTEFKKTTHKKV
jgi:hypothetical protein